MPQFPYSYLDRSGHHIFESQTFVIGLSLLVICPSCVQTTSLVQTPILPPSLNQMSNQLKNVHIGIFICYAHSWRNGDTVHSSEVNDIGQKLATKQWVSA